MAELTPISVAMNAEEIAGPSVEGADRLASTWTRPMTVPMIPIVGAKPPAFSNGIAPSWWRARMPSISASRTSATSSGSEPSTTSCIPLRVKSSSMSLVWESSASRPSRRACSAKPTSRWTRPVTSSSGGLNASLYSVGMRLQSSMPTDASVAPRVPPSTIRNAGMSMNEAGEVPLMIPPTRMPKPATTIPMTVAAFMSIVQSAGRLGTSGPGGRIGG